MSNSEPEDILTCLEPPSEDFFFKRFGKGTPHSFLGRFVFGTFVLAGIIVASYLFFLSPPARFPSKTHFILEPGTGISGAATLLEAQQFIRSPLWFRVFATLLGRQGGIKAGDYYFEGSMSAPEIAWRLTQNGFNPVQTRVTIPEGLSNREIAAIFAKSFPHFRSAEFLRLAQTKEGYLFPDTYLFDPNVSEKEVIGTMEKNFHEKVKSLQTDIDTFKRPLRDIIIMASLLEEETRTAETRKTVAGILWKRLSLGMPLQVDAVFPYIFQGKPYDLTGGDLKVDSPYNTYVHSGLPPGAISNPGLDAMRAALTPAPSEYFYYLSDKNGVMHYAVTHEAHLINRAKYLGK